MPRVPGRIVRRRGQSDRGQPMSPIRLAFEVRPMTGRALLSVDHLAACNEARVVWVGLRRRIGRPSREQSHLEQDDGEQHPKQRSGDAPHLDRSERRYLTSAAAARTSTTISRSQSSPAPHTIPPMPSIIPSIIGMVPPQTLLFIQWRRRSANSSPDTSPAITRTNFPSGLIR